MRVIKSAPERLQVALFPPAAIGSALDDPGWRSRRWLLCHGRVQLIVLLQEGRLIVVLQGRLALQEVRIVVFLQGVRLVVLCGIQ